MYATLHSVVCLYSSSEILSCCIQLPKYGAVSSFPPKTSLRMERLRSNVHLSQFSKTQHRHPPLGIGIGDFSSCSENLWPLGWIRRLRHVKHTWARVVVFWFQIIEYISILNINGLWKCPPTTFSTSTSLHLRVFREIRAPSIKDKPFDGEFSSPRIRYLIESYVQKFSIEYSSCLAFEVDIALHLTLSA